MEEVSAEVSLMVHVLSFLPVQDICLHTSLVSRKWWKSFSSHPLLWQQLVLRDYLVSETTEADWKELYKELSRMRFHPYKLSTNMTLNNEGTVVEPAGDSWQWKMALLKTEIRPNSQRVYFAKFALLKNRLNNQLFGLWTPTANNKNEASFFLSDWTWWTAHLSQLGKIASRPDMWDNNPDIDPCPTVANDDTISVLVDTSSECSTEARACVVKAGFFHNDILLYHCEINAKEELYYLGVAMYDEKDSVQVVSHARPPSDWREQFAALPVRRFRWE